MMARMQKEDFIIKNREGKRMPATLRKPEGEVIGVFVLLHGLGGWKDQAVIASVANAACAMGYRTITFDAADGAAAPDADFFGQTTSGYLEDVEDVMRYLHESKLATQPIVLAGHSMGGLVALTYAASHLKEIEKLVLLAPAVSWRVMWWAQIPYFLLWLIVGHRRWYGPYGSRPRLGRRWVFDFFRFDGYRSARTISIPILIVSAGKDHTVARPWEHRSFARAFKSVTHQVVPGAAHAFPKHTEEAAGIVTSWLTSS